MTRPLKIYFASDLHLGVPNKEASDAREQKFVAWLDFVKTDATEIFLLGDVFDMWFEYKHVIPKGFSRLFGKFAELSDLGIIINYFTGNHDMWVFTYFTEEFGMNIFRKPIIRNISNKKFYIGHGDGLGSGDLSYKFIKSIFSSKVSQWLYARLHPNFALALANHLSKKSRAANADYDEVFKSIEDESLYIYSKDFLLSEHIDYFIFGHRHLALDIPLEKNSRYVNLGEWVKGSTYAAFDGNDLKLLKFDA
ncbi:MAG: UDP-2,3-diacylglucosamine hydrolase [Bacteroidetes bacterium CG2_30_33_31]|nr:MAG: UDP-2,3-diacylglucosamine hydrolase [Bacteroidetes bacterium CG2_30_33_31]